MDTTTPDTKNSRNKHSIYMAPEVWQKASSTAAGLNISTSQLLSRLVIETADIIRPNSLLGLREILAAQRQS